MLFLLADFQVKKSYVVENVTGGWAWTGCTMRVYDSVVMGERYFKVAVNNVRAMNKIDIEDTISYMTERDRYD